MQKFSYVTNEIHLWEVLIILKILSKIIVKWGYFYHEVLQKVFHKHLNLIGNRQKLLSINFFLSYMYVQTYSTISVELFFVIGSSRLVGESVARANTSTGGFS